MEKIKFSELQWSKAGYLTYKDIHGHTTYKPSNQLETTMDDLYLALAFLLGAKPFLLGAKHGNDLWYPLPTKIWYRKQVLDFMNTPGNLFKNGKPKKTKARKFLSEAWLNYVSKYRG